MSDLDSTHFENDDARQDAATSAAIAQGKARLEGLTGRPRAVAAMLTASYDDGGKGLDATGVQVGLALSRRHGMPWLSGGAT